MHMPRFRTPDLKNYKNESDTEWRGYSSSFFWVDLFHSVSVAGMLNTCVANCHIRVVEFAGNSKMTRQF